MSGRWAATPRGCAASGCARATRSCRRASTDEGDEVLLLTSGGYGKRTRMTEFPRQKRGGIGVKAIKLTRVRGTLVAARAVSPQVTEIVVHVVRRRS